MEDIPIPPRSGGPWSIIRGKFLFKPRVAHFILESIESIGAMSDWEYDNVNNGYSIAGSITMVTAAHLALELIEEFLNFPRRSFALARLFFNWAVPSPSGERKTPNEWQLSSGRTVSMG